jgi:acyl-coenzyme A synthetase/AMP-(fatty) acid ligase
VRPHHIYGFLYTIVLPKVLKIKVSFHEPLPSNALFATASDSLLVSTPALYGQIVQMDKKFASNITAVSSTEPLAKKLFLDLKAKGIEKIIEMYGSSETLGVGYKEDEAAYFTLFNYLKKDTLRHIQDELLWSGERLFQVKTRLDTNVKHRGYLIDIHALEQTISKLDGVSECNLVFTKGEIVAFIKPFDKPIAIQSIAQLNPPKPDSIVWMDKY